MTLQDGDTLLMQVKNNPLQESVEVICLIRMTLGKLQECSNLFLLG